MPLSNLTENAPLILGLSILAVFGFFVLLAVGLNMLRREAQQDGPPPAAPPEGKPAGLALPAALADRLTPRAIPSADPNANEVLRVLRDRLTGRVLIELNGKRYTQLSDVTEGEVRRALLLTLRDLQEFAGLSALTVSSAAPPPPKALTPEPPPQAASALPPTTASAAADAAPPSSAEVEAVLSQLNAAPLPRPDDAHAPLKLPSMNIFKQMAQAREMSAKEIAPIKPVVQQIDDVLQHLIMGTPFARQNLHVAAGPTGNVIFEVGTAVYSAVNEIPDRNIQVVFQEAIRRWEQQQ